VEAGFGKACQFVQDAVGSSEQNHMTKEKAEGKPENEGM